MQQQAASLIGSLGASVVASDPASGLYVVAPAPGVTPSATISQFDASPLVLGAQPNYVFSAASGPVNDIVVIFQDSTTPQQAQDQIQSLGDAIVKAHNGTEVYLVEPAAGTDLGSALVALDASPLVAAASANAATYPQNVPNDSLFPNQYSLGNVQAPTAWNVTTGNPRTVVAVLDSGIEVNPKNKDLQNSNIDYNLGYNAYTDQYVVRRDKAQRPSGCKSHPAKFDRSSRKLSERRWR